MPFGQETKRRLFERCLRRCCICLKDCKTRIEVAHIIDEAKGGSNTEENGIPVCFDCHHDIGHYRDSHPRGNKYSPKELRNRRDDVFRQVESGRIQAWTIAAREREQELSSLANVSFFGALSPPLQIATDGAAQVDAAAVIRHFDRMSASLINWRTESDNWIARPEEERLREVIDNDAGRTVCLLGSPGSGKTSLLARIARDGRTDRSAIVAIKADLLPASKSFVEWSSTQLGLGMPLIDAVRATAADRKVVVVVDQLDALASLTDQSTERLNDILQFIAQCSEISQVSVICSCREVEYRYDTRMISLDAMPLTLDLPQWDHVADVLLKAGIERAELWPPAFREILRTPQNLHVYLKRFEDTGNTDPFGSYQKMLDDLWDRKLKSEEALDLVYRITDYLIQEESLWAPAVLFESDTRAIDRLRAEEILERQDHRLGFRHQTLLEHAKARLFTKSGKSLADHVKERQHAVFVRPTIWTVLSYLRDAQRDKYQLELQRLFKEDLRLHVRFLLLDFLGQIADPQEFELVHLAERLSSPDDRMRALIAIRSREPWFHALRGTYFPVMMRLNAEQQWPMVGVIAEAWSFARAECLDLIEDYWLDDPTKDTLTYSALRELDKWDKRSVEMVCRIVSRAESGRLWWVEELLSIISADQPKLAPLVFGAAVTGIAKQKPVDDSKGLWTHSPIESTQAWHDLPAVAEAAPIEFLRVVWPWFVDTAAKYHGSAESSMILRYHGYCFAFEREAKHPEYPILTAVLIAIERTAKADPIAFRDITRQSRSIDNIVVQRVLCRGFIAAASSIPDSAVEFLCEDAKRFQLGSRESHEQSDSIALISAVAGSLGPSGLEGLVRSIMSWSKYGPDAELADEQKLWDRKARLRLLSAIPRTLLPQEVLTFIENEGGELPGWNRKATAGGCGSVREIPPLTKDAMRTAADEEILSCLRGPRHYHGEGKWIEADRCWEEPGGAASATRELGELAKENPRRVLPLLPKLLVEGNEAPATHVLSSLAESDLNDDEIYGLIRKIASLEPTSDELRSQAGYVLYKRCRDNIGLPDDIVAVLEKWLEMPWKSRVDPQQPTSQQQDDDKRSSEVTSVLWGSRGGLALSDGAFWPLLAVTYGYLMKRPAQSEEWLCLMEKLLDSSISAETWREYCTEFRWINLESCNRKRGASVIRKLFKGYPSVEYSNEGGQLIAIVGNHLSPDFLREYLNDLRSSASIKHRQAYGELVTLIALRHQSHEWCKETLEQELSLIEDRAEGTEPVATGIGFAAAQLWDEQELRPNACRTLCRLIRHATPSSAHAVGTVFWSTEDFPADEHTTALLEALAANPNALSGRFIPDLVEHLAKLMPHNRDVILKVATAIVNSCGNELGSIASELFTCGPHLVNIAMTLQRFPDTRSDGLTLLESLLRLGLDDAFAVLRDIDIRPSSVTRREPRPRRRRRRSPTAAV